MQFWRHFYPFFKRSSLSVIDRLHRTYSAGVKILHDHERCRAASDSKGSRRDRGEPALGHRMVTKNRLGDEKRCDGAESAIIMLTEGSRTREHAVLNHFRTAGYSTATLVDCQPLPNHEYSPHFGLHPCGPGNSDVE
jgi:hypothetical protein